MTEIATSDGSRRLGRSGSQVSPLAWGMWRFKGDVREARGLAEAALDAGITLFDTADIYGVDTPAGFGSAETLFGRVLADAPGLRERIVLASKGGIVLGVPYDSSASYLESAIDASLTRLGTDRIDLWQVHRPDILTHPQEIARAAEKAFAAGKIRAFGVSNFTPAQTEALRGLMPSALPLSSIQPEFSALALAPIEDGSLDAAMAHDVAVLAWSPLGGGRIADPTTPREQAVAGALDAVANAHGVSRTAAAYAWIMAHPAGVIPIVGSQQAARICEAADALKVRWSRADWYAVLVASRGEKLP